jgi:Uma2 family endonuclease
MPQQEIRKKFYSKDELLELSHAPENDARRFELSEGVLIEKPLEGGRHGVFTAKIGYVIGDYVEQHNLGFTTAPGTGYILRQDEGKDTVRAPDVGFVAKERLPEEVPDGYVPFAPDLAIEVVSPNDDAEELELKISQYLKYGTHQVWVFYPKLKRVVVHTLKGSYPVDVDGVLDGGEVLPGFKLPLKDIFGE